MTGPIGKPAEQHIETLPRNPARPRRSSALRGSQQGRYLLDHDRLQAVKIWTKTHDGGDYLVIEAGTFGQINPVGWKLPRLFRSCLNLNF
jgi:hypothetical protein